MAGVASNCAGESAEVVVIGAGIVGIATAYFLAVRHGVRRVLLVEPGEPMGLTSAQSGENYRNWWPHPVMTALTDDSTTLMEDIARATGNRIRLTRRGYALATRRAQPEGLLAELHAGYGTAAAGRIRVHERAGGSYRAAEEDWEGAPDGVDVLLDRGVIGAHFPSFAADVGTVLHIRRAGDLSGQQLGQFMLEAVKEAGGRVVRGRVEAVEGVAPFVLLVATADGRARYAAERLVNAAGPFVGAVAAMLGETLPVRCVFQQKIAFEDRAAAVPRAMPFAIDLDGQALPWTAEERAVLEAEVEGAALLAAMPGGVHCRPEGGSGGKWVKLGWAYNRMESAPEATPLDGSFPEIVVRGASRLQPALAAYVGQLPRGARHYGGHYVMTDENWPLIGPMRNAGAFVAGAMSGFGTMSAAGAGALCAAWVRGGELPGYAGALSLERYRDADLMGELTRLGRTGSL